MAGVKGMKTGGSKNAGRPKKEAVPSTEVVPTAAEVIVNLRKKLENIRKRSVAQVMAALDCDDETLRMLDAAKLLPPAYTDVASMYQRASERLDTVERLQLQYDSPLLLAVARQVESVDDKI